MSGTCVISQPMFFPWVGLLEQLRLADAYVHLDDAQYSKGGFTNRVQVKTAAGSRWLTVPVAVHLGQSISEVSVGADDAWRGQHLALLEQAYDAAPHRDEMLALARKVYDLPSRSVAELSMASTERLAAYFGIGPPTFIRSSTLGIGGRSSERVLEIVRRLGCTIYVTGHGARNYLDHALFASHGIEVRYMQYARQPYPQQHGPFDPHVSALDLVANVGRGGRDVIRSGTVPWQEFVSA